MKRPELPAPRVDTYRREELEAQTAFTVGKDSDRGIN